MRDKKKLRVTDTTEANTNFKIHGPAKHFATVLGYFKGLGAEISETLGYPSQVPINV